MSQFKHKTLKTLALCALLGSVMTPIAAAAAQSGPEGRHAIYKTALSDIDDLGSAVLDWKNQSIEFSFDTNDADWTDGLELLLSADPIGRVSSRTPLLVQFNNGKPVPVITRGQGFDTRIKLDKAKIRPRRNKIRFTYKTPTGSDCLLPQHGGWNLNFKDSFIVVKARAKSRNLYLRDFEARIQNAATAPRSVAILAKGENTAKLQALAAQGIGMRVNKLPEFKTTKSNSDVEIVLATRDKLYSWVSNKKILNDTGAKIVLDKGRPMRLIITGDTDEEVMATAKVFASRPLPISNRSMSNLGEASLQLPYSARQTVIDGEMKISDLGGDYFEEGWGPNAKRLKFNVADPAASSGEILLRLASSKNVSNTSRVSLELNGQSLGFTKLDKIKKTVAFDIPEGTLQGTNNQLTITPELSPANDLGCEFSENSPGFYLGTGSKITIQTPENTPVAELSKLTATGAPFSIEHGKDTAVVLPARSSRDYGTSLKVLAKLAKSSGGGLTEADYIRSTNYASLAPKKNILFVGPSYALKGQLRSSAPKGLTAALKGKVLNGTGRFVAENLRFASQDAEATLKLYAARQRQAGRVGQGGVAALYASPLSEGKAVGVITNVPGQSFTHTANQLVQAKHWNSLEGSVARWNKSKVLMAQTGANIPGFALPKPARKDIASKFKLPRFDMPKINFEGIQLGDFDVELAKDRVSNFRTQLLSLIENKNLSSPLPVSKELKVAKVLNTVELKPLAVDAAKPKFALPKLSRNAFLPPQKNAQEIVISNGLKLRGFLDSNLNAKGSALLSAQNKSSLSAMLEKVGIKNLKVPSLKGPASKEQDIQMSVLWLALILSIAFILMGLVTPHNPQTED